MKAIYFEQTGDASDVLIFAERDTPVAGQGEVLVYNMPERAKDSAIDDIVKALEQQKLKFRIAPEPGLNRNRQSAMTLVEH